MVTFAALVLAFATFVVFLAAFMLAFAAFVLTLAASGLTGMSLAAAILIGAVRAVGGGAGGVLAVAHVLAMVMMLAAGLGRIDSRLFRSVVIAASGHTESKSGSDDSS